MLIICLHLFVATQPRMSNKPPARKILEQDQSILLQCEAKGLPLPTITWSVDGHGIDKNARFTITTSLSVAGGRKSNLKIDGLRMSDSGTYKCSAENKAGSVTGSTRVAVNGEYRYLVSAIAFLVGSWLMVLIMIMMMIIIIIDYYGF